MHAQKMWRDGLGIQTIEKIWTAVLEPHYGTLPKYFGPHSMSKMLQKCQRLPRLASIQDYYIAHLEAAVTVQFASAVQITCFFVSRIHLLLPWKSSPIIQANRETCIRKKAPPCDNA